MSTSPLISISTIVFALCSIHLAYGSFQTAWYNTEALAPHNGVGANALDIALSDNGMIAVGMITVNAQFFKTAYVSFIDFATGQILHAAQVVRDLVTPSHVGSIAALPGGYFAVSIYPNAFIKIYNAITAAVVSSFSIPNRGPREVLVATLSNGDFVVYGAEFNNGGTCWFQIYTGIANPQLVGSEISISSCWRPTVAAFPGGFVAAGSFSSSSLTRLAKFANDGSTIQGWTAAHADCAIAETVHAVLLRDGLHFVLAGVTNNYGTALTCMFQLSDLVKVGTTVSRPLLVSSPSRYVRVVPYLTNQYIMIHRNVTATSAEPFHINGSSAGAVYQYPHGCLHSESRYQGVLGAVASGLDQFITADRCWADQVVVTSTTTAPPPTPEPPTPSPTCACPTGLTTDYTSDRIPDACKYAYTTITLNENAWEVVFTVHNVLHVFNGHVIAAKLSTRETAQTAFAPYVSAWYAPEQWNPPTCTLGSIDTPASTLGIAVDRSFNCTKNYTVTYSLVDTLKQNSHCQLVADATDFHVGCALTLSSVRAYDLTEPTAFLSSETTFIANITLPRNLNNNVSDLLYATLAKCNVLNEPFFAVDCRIPGSWTFAPTFTVTQNINWIDAASCTQTQANGATYVRCGLLGIPVGVYTEASANITATETNRNEQMSFSIVYALPRASSATASASLQNYIESVGMLNEKYYYAGADRATISIATFDTSRLSITQLEMFNSAGQSYNLRGYPQFQLTESNNATHFIIEFRPSAIRQDSAFYRNGPHGVNISFLFTAAGNTNRRQMAIASAPDGYITIENIRVQGEQPSAGASASQAAGAAPSATTGIVSSTVIVIAALVAVCVVIVGVIAAVLMTRRRQRNNGCEEDAAPTASKVEEAVHEAEV